jgi:hypothetical protein
MLSAAWPPDEGLTDTIVVDTSRGQATASIIFPPPGYDWTEFESSDEEEDSS